MAALFSAGPARAVEALNVVFDGDSISKGMHASDGMRPNQQFQRMLKRPATVADVAVSGMPVFQCLERYPSFVSPLYRPGALNIIAFHAGDNDIAARRTAEQTYEAFMRYVALAHAQGFRVIVSTELQRPGWRPEWQMYLTQYNRYLVANRAGADLVIDLSQVEGFRDMAQRSNPVYFFQDHVHFSDNGYGILASLIVRAVDRLIATDR